jgi:hypothetical protein
MKTLATTNTKINAKASRHSTVTCSAAAYLYVVGADAPQLSEKAKEQLGHKRPSKRAAKLAAIAVKANVRCNSVV